MGWIVGVPDQLRFDLGPKLLTGKKTPSNDRLQVQFHSAIIDK